MRREIKRRGRSEGDETKHEYKRNIRSKTRSIINAKDATSARETTLHEGDGRSTVPNC